jgi:hypothetical protein
LQTTSLVEVGRAVEYCPVRVQLEKGWVHSRSDVLVASTADHVPLARQLVTGIQIDEVVAVVGCGA